MFDLYSVSPDLSIGFDTYLRALVPNGATTGFVTATTPGRSGNTECKAASRAAFPLRQVLFEALKSQSSGWSGLTLSAARYSTTRALQSGTGQLEAAATMLSRVPMPVAWRSCAGFPCASPDVLLRRKLRLMLLLRYVDTVRPNVVRTCTLVR